MILVLVESSESSKCISFEKTFTSRIRGTENVSQVQGKVKWLAIQNSKITELNICTVISFQIVKFIFNCIYANSSIPINFIRCSCK